LIKKIVLSSTIPLGNNRDLDISRQDMIP
jgi:hypothetical protein